MKKFFTYTAMIILTMTLFTSCDIEFWEDMEDRSEARTLDGTWTGYIDTYYYVTITTASSSGISTREASAFAMPTVGTTYISTTTA